MHPTWSTLVCIQPSAHKDDKKKKKKKGKGTKKKDKKNKKEKKLTQEQKEKQAQKDKEKLEKEQKREAAKEERTAISNAKKARLVCMKPIQKFKARGLLYDIHSGSYIGVYCKDMFPAKQISQTMEQYTTIIHNSDR